MSQADNQSSSPEQRTQESVAGAPSDNTTLSEILASLTQSGYATQFIHDENGDVECTACGVRTPASTFVVEQSRRLEGASDPDDMVRIVATRCPVCGAGGTLVLGYGVNASVADIAVTTGLQPAVTPAIHVPIEPVPASDGFLGIYLRDHHAASTGGYALLARVVRQNAGTPIETALAPMLTELKAEHDVIKECLDVLAVRPSRMKDGAARMAERASRLKRNGRWTTYSPLSRMIELEALAAGITSKRQLWRAFAALSDERWSELSGAISRDRIAGLEQQASRQLETVTSIHAQASRLALGG